MGAFSKLITYNIEMNSVEIDLVSMCVILEVELCFCGQSGA